jgi:hypothetical protein
MTSAANATRSRRTRNRENDVLLDEGSKKKEKRGKMISFRLPASADAYVRKLAKSMGGITPALLAALKLHEGLREGLEPEKFRLQTFAAAEKLDWATNEPEVYVRAIKRGLEDAEKQRK